MIIGIASADFMRADRTTTGIESWGGSGFARYGQYIPYMKAAGHEVYTGTLWKEDTCLAVEQADGTKVLPDLILSQRLMHDKLDDAYYLGRSAGQIIVNDVDDWYWGLSPANDAFIHSHPKHNKRENTTFYKKSLSASSYLTVSTPYLYGRLSDWAKVPTTIIPNYVDVSRFQVYPMTDTDTPLVGWAGSTSHRSGDIEVLRGIIGPMQARGDISLVHAGDYENSPKFSSKLGIEESRVATIPRVGPADYPSILKFEVGLIPLRDAPFNEAKSDIKGLEYAASGIPFVASKLPSYNALFKDWECMASGFYLAKNPAEWIKALQRMRDPQVRETSQAALLSHVKQRDIELGAKELLGYLESLVPR